MKTSVKAQFIGFVSQVDHHSKTVTLGDVQVTLNPWPESISAGDVIETLAHYQSGTWISSEVSHLSNPFPQAIATPSAHENQNAPVEKVTPPAAAPIQQEAPKTNTPDAAAAQETKSHLSVVPTDAQRTSRAGRFGAAAAQSRPPGNVAAPSARPAFQAAASGSSAAQKSVEDEDIPF